MEGFPSAYHAARSFPPLIYLPQSAVTPLYRIATQDQSAAAAFPQQPSARQQSTLALDNDHLHAYSSVQDTPNIHPVRYAPQGSTRPTIVHSIPIDQSIDQSTSISMPAKESRVPGNPRKHRWQVVEIYNGYDLDNDKIMSMHLRLLIRFSKKAADLFPAPRRFDKTRFTKPLPILRMHLDLEGVANPTHGAVLAAVKWMNDNFGRSRTAPLIDFGPVDLEETEMIDLIDFYQVVLAFELRPVPYRIKYEIMRRISEEKPSVAIVEWFMAFIPTGDTTMTRLLNSFADHRDEHKYTQAAANEIVAVIRQRPAVWVKFGILERSRNLKKERAPLATPARRWEQAQERANERARELARGQGQDRKETPDEYQDPSQDQSWDKYQDKCQDEYQEEVQEEAQDEPQDEPQDELRDELLDQSQGEHPDNQQDQYPAQDQDHSQNQSQYQDLDQNQNETHDKYPDKQQDQYPAQYPAQYQNQQQYQNETWGEYQDKPQVQHQAQYPVQYPTHYPKQYPTRHPARYSTQYPTQYPAQYPTQYPTQWPVHYPTQYPTQYSTQYPTQHPSQYPAQYPAQYLAQYPVQYQDQYQNKPHNKHQAQYPVQHPPRYQD